MTAAPEVVVAAPEESARLFAARLSSLVSGADHFALALPGGSAAEMFCPVLADTAIAWERVDLFWCDERAVSPDHPDSNFRIARDSLLARLGDRGPRVHRMQAEAPDLELAASEYERALIATLGERPRFDVVLLGVGPDGHVCSLFPGHPALEERSHLVRAIFDSPKPPPRRLTLTLPALAGAFVVVAAFGASKAAAIGEALNDPDSMLPVARAARASHGALFLLDQDAAGSK